MFAKLERQALFAASLAALALCLPVAFAPATALAQDKPVIRYVFKFATAWWPPEITEQMQKRAAELGVDYQVVGPENGDVAKQVEMIENYVSDNVAAIAVSSLGPASCLAVDDAIDAGTPVVMADGDCPDSKRNAYYGSNNISLGADAATLYAEAVEGKGPQKILVITGTPGAQNLLEREQGFKEKLVELGVEVEFLPTISSYEDTQRAIDAIESSLRGDPSITGVYVTALWPFQAEAAALPLMSERAKAGTLTVVNVDAFPNGLDMVEDGIIYGQVSQNLGQLTYGVLDFAYQVALQGVEYPAVCNLTNQLITKEGGPGRYAAAEFKKEIWDDLAWDFHSPNPSECQ